MERFSPKGNTCEKLEPMKERRRRAAASELTGMIYVTGGYGGLKDARERTLDSVEMFDFNIIGLIKLFFSTFLFRLNFNDFTRNSIYRQLLVNLFFFNYFRQFLLTFNYSSICFNY